MTATQTTGRATKRNRNARRSLTSILTIIIAALAAELVWAIAVPLAGIELVVPQAGTTVGPAAIATSVVLAGLAAWGLRAFMARSRTGLNAWTAIGAVVLALSLGGPALSGASGPVLGVLEIMHVVVGIALIVGLRLSARHGLTQQTNA
ncbi:DUF6069 family protein [Paramicrobacterium chengjingii]|uniref:Uncharacterized protein n=1 Tax=Paramicrobacterium chengjingii TaxID=2769067 RepID=A0ABX6YG98_9MICO|nr:DUF6069 family protein [Microbacterium chengjingii]QPZ37773.1 hypothetical protein HCR76_13255 [Microbacterium chengjingii]